MNNSQGNFHNSGMSSSDMNGNVSHGNKHGIVLPVHNNTTRVSNSGSSSLMNSSIMQISDSITSIMKKSKSVEEMVKLREREIIIVQEEVKKQQNAHVILQQHELFIVKQLKMYKESMLTSKEKQQRIHALRDESLKIIEQHKELMEHVISRCKVSVSKLDVTCSQVDGFHDRYRLLEEGKTGLVEKLRVSRELVAIEEQKKIAQRQELSLLTQHMSSMQCTIYTIEEEIALLNQNVIDKQTLHVQLQEQMSNKKERLVTLQDTLVVSTALVEEVRERIKQQDAETSVCMEMQAQNMQVESQIIETEEKLQHIRVQKEALLAEMGYSSVKECDNMHNITELKTTCEDISVEVQALHISVEQVKEYLVNMRLDGSKVNYNTHLQQQQVEINSVCKSASKLLLRINASVLERFNFSLPQTTMHDKQEFGVLLTQQCQKYNAAQQGLRKEGQVLRELKVESDLYEETEKQRRLVHMQTVIEPLLCEIALVKDQQEKRALLLKKAEEERVLVAKEREQVRLREEEEFQKAVEENERKERKLAALQKKAEEDEVRRNQLLAEEALRVQALVDEEAKRVQQAEEQARRQMELQKIRQAKLDKRAARAKLAAQHNHTNNKGDLFANLVDDVVETIVCATTSNPSNAIVTNTNNSENWNSSNVARSSKNRILSDKLGFSNTSANPGDDFDIFAE